MVTLSQRGSVVDDLKHKLVVPSGGTHLHAARFDAQCYTMHHGVLHMRLQKQRRHGGIERLRRHIEYRGEEAVEPSFLNSHENRWR